VEKVVVDKDFRFVVPIRIDLLGTLEEGVKLDHVKGGSAGHWPSSSSGTRSLKVKQEIFKNEGGANQNKQCLAGISFLDSEKTHE
jgi:hypothetical protein